MRAVVLRNSNNLGIYFGADDDSRNDVKTIDDDYPQIPELMGVLFILDAARETAEDTAGAEDPEDEEIVIVMPTLHSFNVVQRHIHKWKQHWWHTSRNAPCSDIALLEIIEREIRRRDVTFRYFPARYTPKDCHRAKKWFDEYIQNK